MVNIELLKSSLKSKGVTIEQAAAAININPATFYRRINRNGERFTVAEVAKLADLLDMDGKTMERVFFEKKLAEPRVRPA